MDDSHYLWAASWAWGLPLIVLNVVIHVGGLELIYARVDRSMAEAAGVRRTKLWSVVNISVVTVQVTILHGLEAATWACTYRLIGASPNFKVAMLYSLGAMTSYGHAPIFLEGNWILMGALEALNGLLLLGLSTAFLYAMIQKIRPFQHAGRKTISGEQLKIVPIEFNLTNPESGNAAEIRVRKGNARESL